MLVHSLIHHLMHADDFVVLLIVLAYSNSSESAQVMACSVTLNLTLKRVLSKTKEDQNEIFPSFFTAL